MGILDNLESWWSLDETSGTRYDAHGSNDLTDQNTVLYAAGKKGNATDHVRVQAEYLNHLDNVSLSVSDIDFAFAGWCYPDAVNGSYCVLSKWNDNANQRAYMLTFQASWEGVSNCLVWFLSSNGIDFPTVKTVQLSAATWYFFYAYHDAVNNKHGIAINNGTPVEESYSSGVYNNNSLFCIGRQQSTTDHFYYDGRVDELAYFKNGLPSSIELTNLYNGGAGQPYGYWRGGSQTIWVMSRIYDRIQENRKKLGVGDLGNFGLNGGLWKPKQRLVTI